jgi:hypothetical protein
MSVPQKELEMRIVGHLDLCDADKLFGWAIDLDDPDMKLQLTIHSGANLLGTCIADGFRQDLAKAGFAGGHCAFAFEPRDRMSPAELHALRISIVGTEYYFPPRVGTPVNDPTPGEFYKTVATELVRAGRRWPKFDTCILHIGTEKTGSTSLQSCLGLNRGRFEESGYFIPRTLAPHEKMLKHSYLAAISMNDRKLWDDLRRQFQMFDREGLNRGRRNLFISFSEEVASAPQLCRTAILSDEHCHSRLDSSEEVQNLKDFLDHFFEKYRIVLYLRPQHELAISQYGMFIANGICDIDMLPPLPPPAGYDKRVYTRRAYFDYQALLDRWARVFGEDVLDPRIYGANELRGGDVVSDFTSALSLVNGPLVMTPRRNTDISARAQAFLINFYRCIADNERSGFASIRVTFRGRTSDALSEGAAKLRERMRNATRACFPGSGGIPARAQVVMFLEQFANSNEAVRARWFPERQRLFEVDLDKYPESAPSVDFDPEEIMRIFSEVLLMDQNLRSSPRTGGPASDESGAAAE